MSGLTGCVMLIVMIPKADGDATSIGQRLLCVLPVVYRLWTSTGLRHLEAWYSTALDIEEVLSGFNGTDVDVFAADVVKSVDTVDREGGVLDLILGRLGLALWFRKAYFGYLDMVRLRFKLSCGLGELWTRHGGVPQGCPLSVMFIVALCLPWCRALESIPGVQSQLCTGTTLSVYLALLLRFLVLLGY